MGIPPDLYNLIVEYAKRQQNPYGALLPNLADQPMTPTGLPQMQQQPDIQGPMPGPEAVNRTQFEAAHPKIAALGQLGQTLGPLIAGIASPRVGYGMLEGQRYNQQQQLLQQESARRQQETQANIENQRQQRELTKQHYDYLRQQQVEAQRRAETDDSRALVGQFEKQWMDNPETRPKSSTEAVRLALQSAKAQGLSDAAGSRIAEYIRNAYDALPDLDTLLVGPKGEQMMGKQFTGTQEELLASGLSEYPGYGKGLQTGQKEAQRREDIYKASQKEDTFQKETYEDWKKRPGNANKDRFAFQAEMAKATTRTPMNETEQMHAMYERMSDRLAKGDKIDIRGLFSLRQDSRALVTDMAMQKNPKFDPAKLQRQLKLMDYFDVGQGRQNLQALGTFMQHAAGVVTASDMLKRYDSRLLNRTMNWWNTQAASKPELRALQAALAPAQKEFESYLLNNRALYVEDRKEMETIINPNSTVAEIIAAVKQMGKTVKERFVEQDHSYYRLVGEHIQDPFSEDAIRAGKAIGIDLPQLSPLQQQTAQPKSDPLGLFK